ncbi:MAG: pseudouridine synthase [Thermodesulfobacteriota bacterium]
MSVRLNRYLSICGIASRRKADEMISDSSIAVNGEYVTDLGTRIEPEKDIVEVNGKIINPEVERYIILNKPRLYLTTLAEDNNKKTILELIKDIPQRVYPVGRLDYDTEGLLFLTNAGSLANKILHPRNNVPKEYIAIVGGVVDEKALRKMINGNKLIDGFAKPDKISILKAGKDETILKIVFHEGRNRLVKRYFISFDYMVKRLKRVGIGSLKLGRLPKGKWRDLTRHELINLKKSLGL